MTQTYRVTGMTCGGCARSVESAIKALAPAAVVKVDLPNARITVDQLADDGLVEKAVSGAGFTYGGRA
ncbi:MAG: heavy-metal-associated domain-containing protein [Alphaproteobacteria bacterium]|nr:heavy-metal-associated domain-containing protein [Alphaproteobacteria bacterium]MBF0129023.1 heavy-metal-associated domain-containing protein [Alphaproteobacteria bacterium]